jgi:D-beta-D-heptose 7-phosphate kinase/D-beta-D-heptose 1-phosphate adenosyltransferase
MNFERELRGVHALVIGDVMLDEHIWGDVRRISPEAPVPIVEVARREYVPGGAANAAAGIVALGGRAFLGGVVGRDGAAEVLAEVLSRIGVEAGGIVRNEWRCTTTKTRVIAHAQQVVRIDHEVKADISSAIGRQLLDWAEPLLGATDVVIMSDYRKGVLIPPVARGLIELASRSGVPVVVDAKGNDLAKFRGAAVLTPNIREARRAVNASDDEQIDLEEIAARIRSIVPESAILVTRGAEGMTLVSADGRLDVDAEAHEVYDVTGAGDTVVATLATAIGRGFGLETCVRLANTAAAIAVSKVGTTTVLLDELVWRLRNVEWLTNKGAESTKN